MVEHGRERASGRVFTEGLSEDIARELGLEGAGWAESPMWPRSRTWEPWAPERRGRALPCRLSALSEVSCGRLLKSQASDRSPCT